jgi:riboflavin synthase
MFTGIVECMGRVVAIQPQDKTETGGNGWTITIGEASSILNDCKLGDSISVNGK